MHSASKSEANGSGAHSTRPFFSARGTRATNFFNISSASGAPSIQRDTAKPTSAADKLQKAKDELKAKYGLNISELHGAVWTEDKLRQLGASLSKMSPVEQERLKGVTFALTDKFDAKILKGKPFNIIGKTFDTSRVELTDAGLGDAAIHEGGHLLHHNAIAQAEKLLERSQFKTDLETARNAYREVSKRPFVPPPGQSQVVGQMNAVVAAATALEYGNDSDMSSNRTALTDAEAEIPYGLTPSPATKDLIERLIKLGAYTTALMRWSEEKEKVVVSVKRLDAFVGIVKKDKLDKRRSIIFTEYAEGNWPNDPNEFFSEAYKAWRKAPTAVRDLSPDLVAWFERGGHLGPKIPSPRPPAKIQLPSKIQALRDINAKGTEELVLDSAQMFLPIIGSILTLGLSVPTVVRTDEGASK